MHSNSFNKFAKNTQGNTKVNKSKRLISRVAVVTGGNKGIGYAIVKGLCERFCGRVYLTARNEERGTAAVTKLKELGLNPIFHQLDIMDTKSIAKFRDFIKQSHGGIDVLVNNAGIAFQENATEPLWIQAEETINVNYFGTLNVCRYLIPLLRPKSRMINLSSCDGHLSRIPSIQLRGVFRNTCLTADKLSQMMKQYIKDVKAGKHLSQGWGSSPYAVSKVAVTALTLIQQRNFDAKKRDIQVNCVHPGNVDTDLTSHKGRLTIEQGASAPLFLALEPHVLRGQYVWNNSKAVNWFAVPVPTFLEI